MIIRPAKCLRGEVLLPGDKSISHRAAMIAAIAEGESTIENFATSVDCASTLSCLRQLGVGIRQEGSTVRIDGVGRNGLRAPMEALDCGNSGTTMRLMAGILAGQEFDSVLTGDESLNARPMDRVADPLNAMGGKVETAGGTPPLSISGRRLTGIDYDLPVASAQIKSSILLAGLSASGPTSVTEPAPTRDHTERMLRRFGVPVESENVDGSRFRHSVSGNDLLKAREVEIPGDISAAAFFLVGAACLEGSDLTMRNVGVGAGRTAVLGILERCGAELRIDDKGETIGDSNSPSQEAVADLRIQGGLDRPGEVFRIDRLLVPALIDEIPVIAILGTRLRSGIEVRDAGELRFKESDRIAAVVENLRRMGAGVEEFDDGFRVRPAQLKGARVDSFGDHRIAMAFAIAGLMADGETEIDGAQCAAVSFPGFFDELKNVAVYE